MTDFQIFISYRRDGGEDLAGRLSDRLTALGYKVFYDIESMRAGTFNTQIYDAIDVSEDVVLILPQGGLDRCADEADWVRKEIEYAMEKGKNIIPLMMRGFSFPDVLPEKMDGIRYYEAVEHSTAYFDATIQRIVGMLKSGKPIDEPVADDGNEDLKNGIRLLNRKMFPQALALFEKVIREDISDPEAYFYAAVAMLGGKRPFLAAKSVITKVEEYIMSAIAYEERPFFYYFYAYVKYDFYKRKMLRTSPAYDELLRTAVALGITDSETSALFDLLDTAKPDEF